LNQAICITPISIHSQKIAAQKVLGHQQSRSESICCYFVLFGRRIIVLPYMASLIAKKKGNQLYYYVVESARVGGRPRIVHQSYLGSAEKVAALVRDRSAPIPLAATMRDFGLPGALWLAAQQTGVLELLQQTLAPASIRTLGRPLPTPGRHSSHLPTGPENRGGRLV
jgi:hypothetical protein